MDYIPGFRNVIQLGYLTNKNKISEYSLEMLSNIRAYV